MKVGSVQGDNLFPHVLGVIACHSCQQNTILHMHLPSYPDPSQDLMLELHPLDVTVTEGEDITFTCTTNEPAIYEWRFEGGDLPSNAFQDDKMRESSLTIFSANASKNMGAYTCIAFNPDTNVTNEDTTDLDVASGNIIDKLKAIGHDIIWLELLETHGAPKIRFHVIHFCLRLSVHANTRIACHVHFTADITHSWTP